MGRVKWEIGGLGMSLLFLGICVVSIAILCYPSIKENNLVDESEMEED